MKVIKWFGIVIFCYIIFGFLIYGVANSPLTHNSFNDMEITNE